MMSIEEPTTIAVVQLGRLGDTILTTPLVEALAERFPAARITFIASAGAAPIARYAPGVGDLFEVGRGAIGLGGAVLRLQMRAFDLYIDPKDHPSSTSRMLARSAHARLVIAHPANAPRDYVPLPPIASPGHFVDRMLAPIAWLDPEATPIRRPRIGLPSEATVVAARVRASIGDDYVVVNISAGAPSRYWTTDRWIALVQWLAARSPVVVVATPADRADAHAIATTAPNVLAADTNDILELAAVVAGATLVVTPDTSVVHIASAYDVATVALYPDNPDNLRLFAPLATRNKTVSAPPGGAIAEIELDEVIGAIDRVGVMSSVGSDDDHSSAGVTASE
jgi:heptosyltransferase III